MRGTIAFEYDRDNDVVLAKPHWKIATEADVTTWYGQWASYLGAFTRKMDTIVVLDEFEVAPAIGAKWGECRAKLHNNFFALSVRVRSNRNVKLFVNTSGARFNISTDEAPSVEDALAVILEQRRSSSAG
jgi:hypothetical protein